MASKTISKEGVGDKVPLEGAGDKVHVAAVSVPKEEHELVPDTVYPESHSGWHVEPLTRVSVQSPAAPFAGGTAASHALSLRTHAAGGPSVEVVELAYDVNSLQAAWVLS